MPRYFIHIADQEIIDNEGTELAGLAEARAKAVVVSGEMLRDGSQRSVITPRNRTRPPDCCH